MASQANSIAMEPIARAEPLKLRVVLMIAALVGLATWHPFLGCLTFVMLILAELLCTPLLWGLSSILRWFRVRTVVAQQVLFLPFLSLCVCWLWLMNPYQREQGNLRSVFGEQVPRDLKVEDAREQFGKDFSTYKAWVRCDPVALKQVLESGVYSPVDTSDPARINDFHVFPSPASPQVPKEEWLIYQRTTWPKTGPNHHPSAWIITDPTFSWAFVSYVG
jgi:hypothetical protein